MNSWMPHDSQCEERCRYWPYTCEAKNRTCHLFMNAPKMKILQIVNQATRYNRVDGETGYASYINALTDELERLGHECVFIHLSFPVSWNDSEWLRNSSRKIGYKEVHSNTKLYEHVILNDNTLGKNMWEIAKTCDRVIVHATTSVPTRFYNRFGKRGGPKLLAVIHDPAFCNVTYGNEVGGRHPAKWTTEYLFKDPKHWSAVQDVFASWFDGKYPKGTKQDDLIALFNNHLQLFAKCDAVICPSIQVQELLQRLKMGGKTVVMPHPVPHLARNEKSDLNEVVSVLSWDKVDWMRTFGVALLDKTRNYHLVCSEFMRRKIEERLVDPLPSNIKLIPYMSRKRFFDYLLQHRIGQCIHLSRIFETFAFVPYEMAELGIRTIMMDNGSATGTAIEANALRNFRVEDTVNYVDVIEQLDKDRKSWPHRSVLPMVRIEQYTEQLLKLGTT